MTMVNVHGTDQFTMVMVYAVHHGFHHTHVFFIMFVCSLYCVSLHFIMFLPWYAKATFMLKIRHESTISHII